MKQPRWTEKQVAKHWDRIAACWAQDVRQGRDAYREVFNNPEFFKFIGDVKGKRVLDLGCGEGYNTRILAPKRATVVGIDISPEMIRLAKQQEQSKPLGIRYEVGSFYDLSRFADNPFDMAVSFMALMDSLHLEKALHEIIRVIRKNGDFFSA